MIAMVDFKICNLFQRILIQESGAEVSTSFHLWNKNRRAMDRADLDLSTIIFKQTLKDYEMLIGELQMIRIRCRGNASFHLWNKTVAL